MIRTMFLPSLFVIKQKVRIPDADGKNNFFRKKTLINSGRR